ncbi:MAG: tetratricopeptide repeat protein [Gammaproteobacteria bacterium]|nr:tetratricopeptide repeat protein [Gammaproteobacteria bacterium]
MNFSNVRALLFVTLGVLLVACATSRAPNPNPTAADVAAAAASPAPTSTKVEPVTHPESHQAFERAVAALQAGRMADAERELTALIAREPELSAPYANLGIVYARTGRAAQAVEAFGKAIRLNPERPAYYNELGIVHRNEGRFEEARKAYQQALQLDPNYAYAHLNLGILFDVYLQDPEKALPHYERYMALVPAEAATVRKWIADLNQRRRAGESNKSGVSG